MTDDLVELMQLLKDFENRKVALKIKIHQCEASISTIDGFLDKNGDILKVNKQRLKEFYKEDLVDIVETRKVKQTIENIEILRETQIEKKTQFLSAITSAKTELEIIRDCLLEVEEALSNNKCRILEFKNEKT